MCDKLNCNFMFHYLEFCMGECAEKGKIDSLPSFNYLDRPFFIVSLQFWTNTILKTKVIAYETISLVVLTDDSDNCCGSHVSFGDTIPAASFMRQAAGPTFYVKQGLSGRRDVTPPSRVIDFHVVSVVNDSLFVELEWTAPGNDFDQGKGT